MELALKFSKVREILIPSPDSSAGKESACNAGEPGSILGSGISPEEVTGYPIPTPVFLIFPGGSDGEESACSVGDLGLIPGLGRFSGGGHGNPLRYSCLENPHGQRSQVGYSPCGHNWETKHGTIPLKGIGNNEIDFWLGAVSSACSVLGLSRAVILQESC